MKIPNKAAQFGSPIVTNARLDHLQPVASSRWPTMWMNYGIGIAGYGAVVYSEYGAQPPHQLMQGDIFETSIQIFDRRQPGQILTIGYKKLIVPANPKQTQRIEWTSTGLEIFEYPDNGRGYDGVMMTPYIKFTPEGSILPRVGIWGTMNTYVVIMSEPDIAGAFI